MSSKRITPVINHELFDGENLKVGEIAIQVIHTPGHSAGSVCFYLEKYKILIAGDTLFQGSIGRTDLEGGSFEILSASIRHKLYTLPDDTIVITGHGPATTIGTEKKTNAFVRVS
jgi:glyoxylase-like metal-dependent hydrolase (beta-lactamase superfamily II)